MPPPVGLADGRLFFTRHDEKIGRELWVLDPGATAQTVGTGCGRGARLATLAATDPVSGGSVRVTGTETFPNAACALLLGVGNDRPVPLGSGCWSHVDLSRFFLVLDSFFGRAATWTRSYPVPGDPSLIGVRAMLEGWYLGTDAPSGFETTNGVRLTFGP